MGATRFNLQASGAQATTGQGGAKAVAGVKEIEVSLDVTVVSGGTPVLTVYLQSSRDGGLTFFDILHEGAIILSAVSAAGVKIAAGERNIITDGAVVLKASARYNNFGDIIRLAWVIGGTTPSFTFQADAIGKP